MAPIAFKRKFLATASPTAPQSERSNDSASTTASGSGARNSASGVIRLFTASSPITTRNHNAAAPNPRDIANWRCLLEGMTYDEVRSVLGEPEKVDGGVVAFLRYPREGSVTFVSDRVTRWSEP